MSTEMPPRGQDPGAAAKLQILATEHWSLLATRTLTYNESLSRVTTFLTILSGAGMALALVAQVSHFGGAFIAIAIPLLAVVVFTGISTIGRLIQLNGDDFRWGRRNEPAPPCLPRFTPLAGALFHNRL